MKTRVITFFPPYKNSSSNLKKKKDNKNSLRKKIGIRCPHLSFCLPHVLLHIIVSPQHFNHQNHFLFQLTNLVIHNRYWLFLACQIFIQFHTLGLQHVRRIWNILSQHRDMEHWMHLGHIRRQSQPICNHANSLQYFKRSNVSRCQFPFLTKCNCRRRGLARAQVYCDRDTV